MYKTLRKVLLLVLISIAVVCGSLFAVACGKGNGNGDGGDSDTKVTYSVTVTVASDAGVTVSSLKAQWYSGDNAVSDEIALSASGLASVKLDAGNYVVDLVGVPSTATYQKASVTAASPNATINVTKKSGNNDNVAVKLSKPTNLAINSGVLSWTGDSHASSYDVYLSASADNAGSKVGNVNVTSYNIPSDLAEGTHYYSVIAKGDGTNYSDSDRSDAVPHVVSASSSNIGAGTDYWYFDEYYDLVHHAGDPYVIEAVGDYEIPVKFEFFEEDGWDYDKDEPATVLVPHLYAHVIKFTAPEDGEHSYTFSWDSELYSLTYLINEYNEVIYAAYDDACLFNNDSDGVLVFSLSKGEVAYIILQYNYDYYDYPLSEGDEISYEITIESGDPVTDGSLYKPFELDTIDGDHSVPAGYESLTEAYFALPINSKYDTFTVSFGDGISVSVLISGVSSVPAKISSGDNVIPSEDYSTYLYVTATAGTKIEFTLTKVILPGSIDDPIALEKGVAKSYTFASSHSAWFTFTPATSGFYNISSGSGVNVFTAIYEGEGAGQVGDTLSSYGRTDVYLTGGVKYYLELLSDNGNEVSILVKDADTSEGSFANPKVVSTGSNSFSFAEDSNAFYLVYNVSAAGAVTIDTEVIGIYFNYYTDNGYTDQLYGYYVNENYDVSYVDVEAGYLYIFVGKEYSSVSAVNINIIYLPKLDAPVASVSGNTISWTPVDNAAGYAIYYDYYGYDYPVARVESGVTSYDLSELEDLYPGSYSFFVVALGDYESYSNSRKSNFADYIVAGPLNAPTNVVLSGKNLTWDPVDDAVGYIIYKGDEQIGTADEEFFVIPNDAGSGIYYVVAKGDGVNFLNSEKSEPVVYDDNVDYVFTVVDEFNLEGLKVELYVFDPEQPYSRGEKVGEDDVVGGTATIHATVGFYVAVLTGYDAEVYVADQVALEENTTATLTVVKVVYVDFGITIEGLDKVSGHEIHLSVYNSEGNQKVLTIKIESSPVEFKLKDGFSGYVTIEDLPDGFTVDQETINTVNEVARTLYIVAQPTLELDQDWVDVEVLSFKTLNFKLGSSVQTGVQYYLLIDPDSVHDQGPEFTLNHSDGVSVRLTPQGNYWAAVNFSSLQLSIANYDTTTLELRFKLVSTKPATLIEDGGNASFDLTKDTVGEVTTGDSVVDGMYFLSVIRTDMRFEGTITIYVGADDHTGYTFTRANWMITPDSYKVHLQPGVVIRVEVSTDTGVTISVAKAPEGKELTLSNYDGFDNPFTTKIDLSEETAGSTVIYTINVEADIYYGDSDGDAFLIGGGTMYQPLPQKVKVTVDFGGGITESADGSNWDSLSHNFSTSDQGKISNKWTVTIEIAAGASLAGASLTIGLSMNISRL